MSNFIKALATATGSDYKNTDLIELAYNAAVKEGKKSTDLMSPSTEGSTCTEKDWLKYIQGAAKGLEPEVRKVWQKGQVLAAEKKRFPKGSDDAPINRKAGTAINNTIKAVRNRFTRAEEAAAKAEAKANGTEVKAKGDNHDKAIKMLSTLNDFLKKTLSETNHKEVHAAFSQVQKRIIEDSKLPQ